MEVEPRLKAYSPAIAAAFGLALVLLGFCLGWASHGARLAGETAANREAGYEDLAVSPEVSSPAELPRTDVPGQDLALFPRHPNSVRTKHERVLDDGLVVTEIKYMTSAPTDEVREFYRGALQPGTWTVADVEFSKGDWSFFLLSGDREAVVEIEPQNGAEEGLVEIEFELSEPRREPGNET